MFTHSRIAVAALIVACLSVASCSGKDDPVSKLADLKGFEHLSYIPSDTTYAYLALEPLDEDVLDMLEEPYAEMLGAYSDLVSAIVDDINEEDEATNNPFMKALGTEFKDGVSLDTFKKIGIDNQSTGALFGHGVLPVLRLRMADTDKFRTFIARIEKRAEQELATLPVDGMTVWHVDHDDFRIVFAVNDDDFVATIMPVTVSQAVLEQLLGAQKPVKSLADTPLIGAIMKSKSYLAQGLGFVDTHQILNRVIKTPQGVDQALAEEFELENMAETISAVCEKELRTLADTVPRLLFGVTRFDTQGIHSEMLVEVQSELAGQLSRFTAPVPGLGKSAGLFSMGMSFDIGEMQKFGLKTIKELQKNPYECEFLQIEPGELDEAHAAISNPAAGMMQLLQGFNLVIDQIDTDAVVKLINDGGADNFDPGMMIGFFQEHVGVHTVISAKSTEALIGLASMMTPELAALEIKPNGPAVSISNFLPLPLPVDILAAMSDEAFAFAIGKDAEAVLKTSLAESSEDHPPLFSYSINGKAYMELLDALLESPALIEGMSKDKKAKLTLEQTRRLVRAFYGLTGDMMLNVRMRDDGIVMEQMVDFN